MNETGHKAARHHLASNVAAVTGGGSGGGGSGGGRRARTAPGPDDTPAPAAPPWQPWDSEKTDAEVAGDVAALAQFLSHLEARLDSAAELVSQESEVAPAAAPAPAPAPALEGRPRDSGYLSMEPSAEWEGQAPSALRETGLPAQQPLKGFLGHRVVQHLRGIMDDDGRGADASTVRNPTTTPTTTNTHVHAHAHSHAHSHAHPHAHSHAHPHSHATLTPACRTHPELGCRGRWRRSTRSSSAGSVRRTHGRKY